MHNKITGLEPGYGKSALSTQDVNFKKEMERRKPAVQTGMKQEKTTETAPTDHTEELSKDGHVDNKTSEYPLQKMASDRYTVNDNSDKKDMLKESESLDLNFALPGSEKDVPDMLKVRANIRSRNGKAELIVRDISLQHEDSDAGSVSIKIPGKEHKDIVVKPEEKKEKNRAPDNEVNPKRTDSKPVSSHGYVLSDGDFIFPGLPPKTIHILFNYYQDAAYYIIFVRFLKEFLENERKLFEYLRRRLIDYAIENDICRISWMVEDWMVEDPLLQNEEINENELPFNIFYKMKGN